MNFVECPVLYIDEYFGDKVNKVDILSEKAILEENDVEGKECLNKIRLDLIEKIKSVKQSVKDRLVLLESQYTPEKWLEDGNKIKDEVFLDQYCFVFDFYERFPIFEIQCGVVVFSQFDDELIEAIS